MSNIIKLFLVPLRRPPADFKVYKVEHTSSKTGCRYGIERPLSRKCILEVSAFYLYIRLRECVD